MKNIFLKLIDLYQNKISRYTAPKCCYIPTCSNYAIIAIERFGVLKGFILFLIRFLKCNPFSKGGYDPVPDKFTDIFQFNKK